MKKLTTKALSTRLSIVIIFGLLFISAYSIFSTYKKHINASQNAILQKLHSITKTSSLHIDGDIHQKITEKYILKDEIKNSKQDDLYNVLHKQLKAIQVSNDIPTDIYTLFFNKKKDKLYFAISSGDNPYYRHEYKSYPATIKIHYEKGGIIGPYTDDHGTWLSAFSPIKNNKGEAIAILQADIQFDSFIEQATDEMYANIFTSIVVFLVITTFVMYTVYRLSKIDEEKNVQLNNAFDELKTKNKNITDSINYARRIQKALVPKTNDVQKYLPESFMFYEPKDVVSGDFPWFYKKGNYIYFAAVDCTGHGVPGAMMSIIGCLLLNDIVNSSDSIEPGELLNDLHQAVVETLKQYENTSGLADGMDVAMCRIDLQNNEVQYAGAHRPLYHIQNNELTQYKGCKYPIGGAQYGGKNNFKNQTIEIKKGDAIYFFSDGLPDQFGGEEKRKFGPRRIREILLETENFKDLEETFDRRYREWKGESKQIDDILMIGIRF